MSQDLGTIYGGRVDTTDPNYPYGKPRNRQGDIEGTGTPYEELYFQDISGAFQALLVEGEITPSGNPDNATNSDIRDAILKMIRKPLVLKIFQSPTEGGLTEISTRTLDSGEVYEVRKVSDDSLATIYSDAEGTTEIVQNGTSNVSGGNGVVEFYIADGDYYITVSGSTARFKVFIKSLLQHANVAEVNSGVFAVGDRLVISDRSDARFDIVSGLTPNGLDILDAGGGNSAMYVIKQGKIDITSFGAAADSTQSTLVTDNSPAINRCINYLIPFGGGEVHIPAPHGAGAVYGISTDNEDLACIRITGEGICISGNGERSILQVYNNKHVPIHICTDQDLTNPSPVGDVLTGFEFKNAQVRGTNIYENFGLAYGRGILFRNAKKVNIHDGWVTGMSMIGVCAEGGDGYFSTRNMQLHGNRYTAVNYNGRCYQSFVEGCVISGCNGGPNSLAIQVTGHSTVSNCTVFGEISNTVNCGGISWGEGNYNAIGGIYNCLVKHCAFGYKAVYHDGLTLIGNNAVNCLNQGGFVLVGGTAGGFTIPNKENNVIGNTATNCAPYGFDCSAKNTNFEGNKVRTFTPITNPSAGTEPDAIVGVTTQAGIRIRAEGCSVRGGEISGVIHGLLTTIGQSNGVISGIEYKNNTHDRSQESQTSGVIAATGTAVEERLNIGSGKYREVIARASRPNQGYFELSSRWDDPTPAIGAPIGQIVLFAQKGNAVSSSASGSTLINIGSTTGWFASATATVLGVELDNGAWHWTTLDAVDGVNITLGVAIPVGRSVNVGGDILYNSWRNLQNL